MDLLPILTSQTLWVAVGAIGTICALAFAANQILLMQKQAKFDSDWRRKEKASELSKFYAEEIIPRMSYANRIIMAIHLDKLMRGVSKVTIKEFSKRELDDLAGQNIINEINSAIANLDVNVFKRARSRLREDQRLSISSKEGSQDKNYYINEYHQIVSDMLNKLEYFSMCLNSDIADKKLLYQSLHQTFFAIVTQFYYALAKANNTIEDRYYTHITKLYFVWMKEYGRKCDKAKKELLNDYSVVETFRD